MGTKNNDVDEFIAELFVDGPDLSVAREAAQERAVNQFIDHLHTPDDQVEPIPPQVVVAKSRKSRWLYVTVPAMLVAATTIVWLAEPFNQTVAPIATGTIPVDQRLAAYASNARKLVASRTNSRLAGGVMASGIVFDPNDVVAASSLFPLGTVLEVQSVDRSSSITVTVRDVAEADLVLSDGATRRLQVPEASGKFPVWVRARALEGELASAPIPAT